MIVVIADDLSGAAELAGAAVRHGLSAEVQTTFFPGTSAEVVCVDTDSRMLPPAEAARRVAAVTRSVVAAKPAWIFKKCDSVLRGPVLAEARAVAEVAGNPRILLIPANPSRGRTIRAGTYLLNGQPLNETFFASDPSHPRWTAGVTALLDGDLGGITVPDILTAGDVRFQASIIDAESLPVGAADFFTALLMTRVQQKISHRDSVPTTGRILLVCGSATAWAERSKLAQARGTPIFALPHDVGAVVGALRTSDAVLLGIGAGPETWNALPATLDQRLAQSVADILRQTRVERLLLEGGATSAATIAALGWTRLQTEEVADSGVAVLRPVAAHAPLLFIKPGSYPWPAALWG
jgi:uncharacterized protein YgbK (DUF1537 family)